MGFGYHSELTFLLVHHDRAWFCILFAQYVISLVGEGTEIHTHFQ